MKIPTIDEVLTDGKSQKLLCRECGKEMSHEVFIGSYFCNQIKCSKFGYLTVAGIPSKKRKSKQNV